MRLAVVGDAICDIDILGSVDGACPENKNVLMVKGLKASILPGGAANVATLLTEMGATVDLITHGPGNKDKAWIGDFLKRTTKANRICWSGEGSIPLKIRGYNGNQVAIRVDAEEYNETKNGFVALQNLLIDIEQYAGIIVSDYCKGVVCKETEDVIRRIIKKAKVCVVDSKRQDYSLWYGCTAITPNMDEAARIYGTTVASEVRSLVGADAVYITQGPKDVLLSFDGQDLMLGVEAIDEPYCVGAGDAFAAGVTIALSQGKSFVEAGQTGVALASKYVPKPRRCSLR